MDVNELDKKIEEMCNVANIPGMALLAAKNGEVIYEKNYGYRHVERKLPVTNETIFGVASLTKSFAALAILQLQDKAKLSVHDEVTKWLPELTAIQPNTTIHHLLTHTAGYPGMAAFNKARLESLKRDPDGAYLFGELPLHEGKKVASVSDLIGVMNEEDFSFIGKPGELFNYSNESYALLQEIIERASGMNFEEFIDQNIFNLLQMDRSFFKLEDVQEDKNVTDIYAFTKDTKKEVFHSPIWWDSGEIYSAGALKSTTNDLIKYLEIYRKDGFVNGKRIVSQKAVNDMLTPYFYTLNDNQYGYGFLVGNYAGVNVAGHGGGVKGVSSYMLVAKEEGMTISVLTNIAEVAAENIALVALRYLLDIEEPVVTTPAFTMTNAQLQKYSGRYKTNEGQEVEVTVKDSRLSVRIQHNTLYVTPFAEHIFQLQDGKKIAFLPDDAGKIKGIFRGMRYLQKVE